MGDDDVIHNSDVSEVNTNTNDGASFSEVVEVVNDNPSDTVSSLELQLSEFNERLLGVSDNLNGFSSNFNSLADGQTSIISRIDSIADVVTSQAAETVETVAVNENGYTAYEQEVINQLNGINTMLFVFFLCGVGVFIYKFIRAFF